MSDCGVDKSTDQNRKENKPDIPSSFNDFDWQGFRDYGFDEEVIQFAEDEANKIIEKLKTTKVEAPKKNFFSRK